MGAADVVVAVPNACQILFYYENYYRFWFLFNTACFISYVWSGPHFPKANKLQNNRDDTVILTLKYASVKHRQSHCMMN